MNAKTYASLARLKTAIKDDPRFKKLKEAEKAMGLDEEAKEKAAIKERLSQDYDDACAHFGDDSALAKDIWHNLYINKDELDRLPSVRAYMDAYVPLARIYRELDALLFLPYRELLKCEGKQ